jgi:hypothetical protein
MNNFAKGLNRRMVQAAAIGLIFASATFSMGAAVQLPEDESALNALLLPEVEHLPPVGVEGKASGMSTPVTEVTEQTNAPRIFLRRSLLPGSVRVSVGVFALQSRNETTPAQALSVDRNTDELWFGPSQNCRRFEMVCRLGGLP